MSRMWKILEDSRPYESFRHGKGYSEEAEEAYECGYEEGFGDAMRKVEEEKYGHLGFRGESTMHSSSPSYGSRMGYRDDEDDMMGERRRRRRNGRFY